MVHAVDEGEVDRQAAQLGAQVVPAKNVVARLGEHLLVRLERRRQLRLRVDADRDGRRAGEAQRIASGDADLDVGARPHRFDDPARIWK